MTTVMRGRKTPGLIAAISLIAVVALLVVFGVLAWRAGGPQPLKDVNLAIPTPGQNTPGQSK